MFPKQPLFANTDMAQNWHKLGFVVRVSPTPNGGDPVSPIFVEKQRQTPHAADERHPAAPFEIAAFAAHAHALASHDAHARAQEIPHSLPPPDAARKLVAAAGQNTPINTLESLKRHLQFAIAVELSTIPMYLYAQFSIKSPDKTGNGDAAMLAMKGPAVSSPIMLAQCIAQASSSRRCCTSASPGTC